MQWNNAGQIERGRLFIVIRSSALGRRTSQELLYVSTAVQDAKDQRFVPFNSIKDDARVDGKAA